MEPFLKLAGELFLVIFVQSVLEIFASSRKQYHFHKVIFLGCYLASLALVLNFMYQYFFQMIPGIFNAL
jgi:hypothetical protein